MASITEPTALTPYQGKLEYDRQVKARAEELVVEGGFSEEDADGNDVPDWEAFKNEGAVVLIGHRVDKPADRAKGLTAHELLEKVLPDVDVDVSDPVDNDAWGKLARRIWGITQPGPSGFVQKQLAKPFVLIRVTLLRISGTTAPAEKVKVAFVTANDDIIIDDSLMPVIDEVIAGASKIHKQAELIHKRKPELGQRITKAITSGTERVANNARFTVAGELNAGESPGSEAAPEDRQAAADQTMKIGRSSFWWKCHG